MTENRCFIIAEAGVNHNGSLSSALEMIQVAAECGADAIKFQTFSADKLVTKYAKTANYQKENGGFENQYEMLKGLELKESDYPGLIDACSKYNIEFMSTPFDEEALDFLVSLGMRRIKVPSGELTNLPFLRKIASKNLPIILSTGMGTIEEIEEAVDVIESERAKHQYAEPIGSILTILHCTSNYPCPNNQANLKAISTIKDKFSVPVGYSDHTLSINIAYICMGLGVSVYEKHFTLDKNLPGPDHLASLLPEELKTMINNIRTSEIALGNGVKEPTASELDVRKLVRKSCALNKNKKAGDFISSEDLILLRPGTGIEPKFIDQLVNRRLKTDVMTNDLLQWSNVE